MMHHRSAGVSVELTPAAMIGQARLKRTLKTTIRYWAVKIAEICGWLNIVDQSLVVQFLWGEEEFPHTLSWRLLKTIEDKFLASALLILAAPCMVIIAMLVKLDSRGPVLFRQKRFGYKNETIDVLKFRTMYIEQVAPSGAQRGAQHDPRVTRVGRVLRSLSLDELPQLINVVRGDMSLVGPRPYAIAMEARMRLHSALAEEEYSRRHRVKPGITGWAQVNGLRGEVDTLEKARVLIEHDLFYIDHWSPWFDLKILLKTVGLFLSRADAY